MDGWMIRNPVQGMNSVTVTYYCLTLLHTNLPLLISRIRQGLCNALSDIFVTKTCIFCGTALKTKRKLMVTANGWKQEKESLCSYNETGLKSGQTPRQSYLSLLQIKELLHISIISTASKGQGLKIVWKCQSHLRAVTIQLLTVFGEAFCQ